MKFDRKKDEEKEITWCDTEHEEFYFEALKRAQINDVYHRALFFALGSCPDTRHNIDELYNFVLNQINPDALNDGWITSGSHRVVLLAFNLFNGFALEGCERFSTPYELFDCSFAPYMLTAIKLRYPESFRE